MRKNEGIVKEVLNGQHQHWENMLFSKTDIFGTDPSDPAPKAAELFKKEGKVKILELGGGQGRDTTSLLKWFPSNRVRLL